MLAVGPEQITDWLGPLPVDALPDIGPRQAQLLRDYGIHCVGLLAAIPPATMQRLLGGRAGRLAADRARGIDPRPVAPRPQPRAAAREGAEVPSLVNRLVAGRQITAMRMLLQCSTGAVILRQGPAAEPGTDPAWFAFLCLAHSEDLPDWPANVDHTDDGLTLGCGTILDFRPAEQLLQSHADLWLTPMTGVQPPARNDAWVDVLDQAYQVLDARAEANTDNVNDPPPERSADDGHGPPECGRWQPLPGGPQLDPVRVARPAPVTPRDRLTDVSSEGQAAVMLASLNSHLDALEGAWT
ncbi:hypothetical protein AB0D89_32595 [Streptomyces luteogriseus]|uniref:hypothetical protein n=1 Tax=Streptomyces luteogriseus TaxID=68233 RepID=UPI0033E81E14